jgi:phosphomannomutase
MDRLRRVPPEHVGGVPVSSVCDFRRGGAERPRWRGNASLVELQLGARGRALVRPSGTEPKLKIYVDLRRELPAQAAVWTAEAEARAEGLRLATALAVQLGLDTAPA